MGLNNMGFGLIFSARDLASSVMSRLSASFGALDGQVDATTTNLSKKVGLSTQQVVSSLTRMAAGLGVAAVGFKGLQALFGGATKEAADFESVMLQIQQKTGFADDAIEQLGNQFLKLSATLPLSAAELAKVGVIAGQLGVQTAKGIEALAFTSAQLARVSDFSEETGAAALARLANVFQLPIEQADRLASTLVKLSNTSTATASQISDITIRFAGVARTMGVTADQAQALAATLVDAGVTSEIAGSGLARLLVEMTNRSAVFARQLGQTEDQFKTAFSRDAVGQVQKFAESFAGVDKFEIPKRLKEMGLAGVRVQQVVLGLAGATGKLSTNLENASKAFSENTELNRAFEAELKGVNARLDTLFGSIKNVAIAIGQRLAPAVKLALDFAISFFDLLLNLPDSVQNFLVLSAVIGSLAATFFGLATAIVAAWPFLVAIGAAASVVLVPFLKIIAIVAAVTAAITLLSMAWKENFLGIRNIVGPVIEGVRAFFQGLLSVLPELQAAFAVAFGEISTVIGQTRDAIASDLGPVLADLARALGFEFAGDGLSALKEIGAFVGRVLLNRFKDFLSTLVVIVDVVGAMVRAVAQAIRWWAALGATIREAFGAALDAVVNGAIASVNGLLEGAARIAALAPGGSVVAQTIRSAKLPSIERSPERAPDTQTVPAGARPTIPGAPEAIPQAPGGPTSFEMQQIIEAFRQRERASEATKISVTLEAEGRALAEVQETVERERSARSGAIASSIGG